VSRSLYGQLALILLVLLLLFAGTHVAITLATDRVYTEVAQQVLHRDLAAHIAAEEVLLDEDGAIRRDALDNAFHMLMVVNPSIEVYLLAPDGAILDYSAPPGRVRLDRVDLGPVNRFLTGETSLPTRGDDPRNPGRRKIFSAAPVTGPGGAGPGAGGPLLGYLYVVLGGEETEAAFERVAGGRIRRLALWTTGLSLALALLAGLGLFWVVTRRLRRLDVDMRRFAESGFAALPGGTGIHEETPFPGPATAVETGDEIERLRATFDGMARRIVSQLDELERMDAERRELLVGVFHDLRTPLANVQGYLDTLTLKQDTVSPEDRRHYLAVALRQSEQLGRLVDGLFELAKLDSTAVELHPEPMSMTELVQDVAQEHRLSAAEKEIALEVELPRAPAPVVADLALVERLLTNLLGNALRFTPRGGSTRLHLEALPDPPEGDGGVRLTVADTGPGIPEEEIDRIFDRYYKSAGVHGESGSGLGLAIARRVVELHGGTIRCDSRVGEGTVFTVWLPAGAATRAAPSTL
jgi:two-component system, OmpR family, sensor kinase